MVVHRCRALAAGLALAGILAGTGPIASATAAEFGIAEFSARMLDAEGNPETRAGSHPDRLQIDFELETEGTGTRAKDLAIELPPGFSSDPTAVPACPRQAHEEGEGCPADSQVGSIGFGGPALPVFSLEAAPGQPAALVTDVGADFPFELELRPDDFGITFAGHDLPESAPSEGHIELWGVPADHHEAPAPQRRPFLTAPPLCGPLPFGLGVRSHQPEAPWLRATSTVGPLVGCEGLPFAPRLDLQLSNPVADAPTGVRMALSLPSAADADELGQALIRDVSVELPPGLGVSAGGLSGLAQCSEAQLGLDDDAPAACPAASRIGGIEFVTPALPEPLNGGIYLGAAQGSERFRLFAAVPVLGTTLKFATSIGSDASAGHLVATLRDLPKIAISRIAISLDGGPGALLAAPLGCGPLTSAGTFVPYGGGPEARSSSSVDVASPIPGLSCPGPLPFAPQLEVSASSHRAGRPSSLSSVLARRPGEDLPSRFWLSLPAGLSTALGTVESCSETAAATGACPPRSRVGSALARVGSSFSSASLAGGVYLAGPYHGAPFSLVMAFDAAIGPFDLGRTSFRAAAQIDGRSGVVTVATDRMPTDVEGVPIRFQAVSFGLDRGGLVRNPTGCGPHVFAARVESQRGAVVDLSQPYPVRGCRKLGFAPRVRLSLAGARRLRKGSKAVLRVSARLRRDDAALRSLTLALPPVLELDVLRLGEICSLPDARRGLCGPGARVGAARARTTLLAEPLRGSVYVVQPPHGGEPDLWTYVAGAGVRLSLRGKTTVEHGRLLTRIAGLPDIPLSEFSMRLGAGAGLLSLAVDPCRAGKTFSADLIAGAQNGAHFDARLPIGTGRACRTAGAR